MTNSMQQLQEVKTPTKAQNINLKQHSLPNQNQEKQKKNQKIKKNRKVEIKQTKNGLSICFKYPDHKMITLNV